MTLGELVERLDGILHLVAVPRGLDVVVNRPVLRDPAAPEPIEPGDVVLAVGTHLLDVPTLVAEADAAGAAAVVIRTSDGHACAPRSTALITARPETPWGHLYLLLQSAIPPLALPARPELPEVPIGDLFALANAIAGMVGEAVLIQDPHAQLLAYSAHADSVDQARQQTIFGRCVAAHWIRRLEEDGFYERLLSSRAPARFEPGDGIKPRVAVVVRVGPDVLGSIWLAESSGPLSPEAAARLEQAADIAAVHLLRHRDALDHVRHVRADLLTAVLEGHATAESAAQRLGLAGLGPFTVVAIEFEGADGVEELRRRQRALDMIGTYFGSFRRRSITVALGEVIYVLVTGANEAMPVVRLTDDLIERALGVLHHRLRAAIGPTVTRIDEITHSRHDADKVLRVLALDHAWSVATTDALRERIFLLELQHLARERPHWRLGRVARLFEHDERHDTPYVETLRALFDAFGNIRVAAERVHVHHNTFRYRLSRIQELTGVDLDDRDARLAMALQLHLFGDEVRDQPSASISSAGQ